MSKTTKKQTNSEVDIFLICTTLDELYLKFRKKIYSFSGVDWDRFCREVGMSVFHYYVLIWEKHNTDSFLEVSII